MLNMEWYKSSQILNALRVSFFNLHRFLCVRHLSVYFALTSKRRQAEIFSRHQSSLVNIGKINMAAECLRIVAKELME